MTAAIQPAAIVSTPGTCGGRPRLFGHRLTIDWYASLRNAHGKAGAHKEIRKGWDYLREDQIRALSDCYERGEA